MVDFLDLVIVIDQKQLSCARLGEEDVGEVIPLGIEVKVPIERVEKLIHSAMGVSEEISVVEEAEHVRFFILVLINRPSIYIICLKSRIFSNILE